jgi:hypothetical protein
VAIYTMILLLPIATTRLVIIGKIMKTSCCNTLLLLLSTHWIVGSEI